MAKPQLPTLKILGLTPRTNCRECGAPSCMTFAVQVTQGQRSLADCPYVEDPAVHEQELVPAPESAGPAEPTGPESNLAKSIARLRELSLPDQAARLGLPLEDGRVVVPVLGRRFYLDAAGGLQSESHVNPWVHLPILQYVVLGVGRPLSGEWVAYNKLPGAVDWELFFDHSCTRGLDQINRRDPDFLEFVLDLFSTTPPPGVVPDEMQQADQVAFLRPLPGVGMLIRRWLPEGDFAAQVTLLFDRASGDNLDPGSLFFLTRGLLEMFRKLEQRHGSAAS